ncbi:MAG: EF2563 family selenium-dependent molybdenum hydroxylase system protein [Chloroflexi bacterium]|nr:EF2563 family selenium-dependent molybdenum hydroxylase system protein [Chloroflexota bacterium]
MFSDTLTVVKGAGDMATGCVYRLVRAGFPVICTEIAGPTVVRRTVAFAEAILSGEVTVEDVCARRTGSVAEAVAIARQGDVAVLIDPDARVVREARPAVLVDAIMAKRNLSTSIGDAPIVIALGPGFTAGVDCHAVIETNRGHNLGRVIWEGQAEPNTGVPGNIGGFAAERLVRAPADGIFEPARRIGDVVEPGDLLGTVAGQPVQAEIRGVLRGLIRDGLAVGAGMKIGDVDPRARPEHCLTISDKSLAVGGGVLEAVLYLLRQVPAASPVIARER